MKTTIVVVGLLLAVYFVGSGSAQDESRSRSADVVYRVFEFEDLFANDVELKSKADSVTFSGTYSDGSEFKYGGVRRIDMDAKDYEVALNRMAADGWTLVCVTKANYWIFSKQGSQDKR